MTSPAGTQEIMLANQPRILGRLLLLSAVVLCNRMLFLFSCCYLVCLQKMMASTSKAQFTHVSFVLSMLVMLQGRRNFSLGRTSTGNRSCVLAQKLQTILVIWNRMLWVFDFLNRGSILQALVASQSRVMAKDLNEELSNLGLL